MKDTKYIEFHFWSFKSSKKKESIAAFSSTLYFALFSSLKYTSVFKDSADISVSSETTKNSDKLLLNFW